MTAVPVSDKSKQPAYFKDNDQELAKTLLAEGMKELGLTKLPPIAISLNQSPVHQKVAAEIQRQWKQTLGVEVQLRELEWKVFLENLHNGDYQIGRSGWFADYADPANFLEHYKEKDGGLNDTKWENKTYQSLLQQAASQADPAKRQQLLAQAEKLLMDEMPVIPIYFYTNNWVQDKKVKGIVMDDLGYIDFKWASKE